MAAPTFAAERIADLWAEIAPLLERHWREIAHYPDIALDVDRHAYEAAEQAGGFRCYVIRLDGALIGYAGFFLRRNIHYRGSLQAVQDVLFLAPEHRRGGTGLRFIRWCDDALALEGVQAVYQHVKLAHNFGPLLERLGYEPVETIYARRLDCAADG